MSDSDRVVQLQANQADNHLPRDQEAEDNFGFHQIANHTAFLNNLNRSRTLSLASSNMDDMDITHHQQHQIGSSHLEQELIDIHGLHQVQTIGQWVAPPTANVHELEEELQQLNHIPQEHGGYAQPYNAYHTSLCAPLPDTPDLLKLLHFSSPWSAASFLTSSSITSFTNPSQKIPNFHQASSVDFVGDIPNTNTKAGSSSLFYDPKLFHLNLPLHPQAPLLFRELVQSHNTFDLLTSINASNNFSAADHDMEANGSGTLYHDEDGSKFDNGLCRDSAAAFGTKGRDRENVKNEKQRRQHLTDNFQVLRSLIPNPTKHDRASVVGDAIEYIKKLSRSVNDLKETVERRRCLKENRKQVKTEKKYVSVGDMHGFHMKALGNPEHDDPSLNGPLIRSSWLHRKSRDTEVDVRVIDDDVTIKLVQRKKNNCLLFVSKVLEELELDIHHVAGGYIGDYCSFLFNAKTYEGSAVYASAVASKLIEVMDPQYDYAALISTSNN